MSGSRRAPDRTQELRCDEALRLLVDELRQEDRLLPAGGEPWTTANAHLSRCQPRPARQSATDGTWVPESRCRCCGKAMVILRLAGEVGVATVLQRLYAAVVEARGPIEEAASLVAPAVRDLAQAFREEREALTRLGVEVPAPEDGGTRGDGTASPAGGEDMDADERRTLEVLRVLDDPGVGDTSGEVLRRRAMLFVHTLFILSRTQRWLERRLRGQFAIPRLHVPTTGRGRPAMRLFKECARILAACDHSPSEIARLLPSHGTEGAADRVREHLRTDRPRSRKQGSTSDGAATRNPDRAGDAPAGTDRARPAPRGKAGK